MKFNQLASIFTASLFSALIVGCGGGSSDDSIKPTKAMYDQLTIGMTYTQAVAIVGKEGILDGGFGDGNKKSKRTWSYGNTTDNANLFICIPNGTNITFKSFSDSGTFKAGVREGDINSCV